MVLKKSNTPLNSGATQKCFKRNTYKAVHEKPSGTWLTFTLRGLPVMFDEKNPSKEHVKALEKIYDYLGFDGPDLKTFYAAAHDDWNRPMRSLSFSLHKQGISHVPERIDNLIKDKNVLDGESGLAEIRIIKVQKIAERTTFQMKKLYILNPEVRNSSKSQSRKNKVKHKGKTRGLQRPHLFIPEKPDSDESDVDDEEFQFQRRRLKKVVEVEIQAEDQFDARMLKFRPSSQHGHIHKRKTGKTRLKVPRSLEGNYFNRFSMSNSQDLEREMDNLVAEMSDYDTENDIIDISFDYDDQAAETFEVSSNHQGNLGDYVVQSDVSEIQRGKILVENNIDSKHDTGTDDLKLVNVNTASSQVTLRHPKGSFQFIKKPDDIISDKKKPTLPESNPSPDDSGGDDFQILSEFDDGDSGQFQNEVSNEWKPQPSFTLNALETYDPFITLKLHIPRDIEEQFASPSSLLCNDAIPISSGFLMLGNCFPPVFNINVGQGDNGLDKEWSLVAASSSDMSDDKNFTWEVALKNSGSSTARSYDSVKDAFLCNLDIVKNGNIDLDDVINIASNIVNISLRSSMEKECPKSMSKSVHKRVKDDISTYDKAPIVDMCSKEEAATRLRSSQQTAVHNSVPTPQAFKDRMDNPSGIMECYICFEICDKYGLKNAGMITLLPCNHSFCSECWRSHIIHYLMTGHTEFKCMDTDCKETLNDTMVKALIPEHYLAKLYLHKQEKIIETSPLCRWCPKTKCDKVAMIPETNPQVKQFGCRVECDCLNSWCFSCQSEPHWPASCSQTAAYRKLQQKLGVEIPKDVSCDIELKPCPGCGYPTEKDEGCPFMSCNLCEYMYCWICLERSITHNPWYCTVDESNTYITYELHNDVINSFPLKFFQNSLDMKGKNESIDKDSIKGWLLGLKAADCRKIKLPFRLSVKLEEPKALKKRGIHLASESLSFLRETYSFLEYFYLVFSFALLSEDEDNHEMFHASIQRNLGRLVSAALKLEECVVGKTFQQLLAAEKRCEIILDDGFKVLGKLKSRVAVIQTMSKDVPAEPIALLEPDGFYRIK